MFNQPVGRWPRTWFRLKPPDGRKIETRDEFGKPNGYLIPIWNANDNPELRPEQVYLTAVAPHSHKGPHLHLIRRGLFCCIKGNVRVVTRKDGEYSVFYSGEDNGYAMVTIPPGIVCAIYNDEETDAMVLNLPAPAWSREQPDEHEVKDWNP